MHQSYCFQLRLTLAPRGAGFGYAYYLPCRSSSQESCRVVRKCVMITLANMLLPANLPSDQPSIDLIRATLAQGALDSDPYVSESISLWGLPARELIRLVRSSC